MKSIALAGLVLLLAGCGGRDALQLAPGQRETVAPAMAPRAMTTDELLTAPPITAPQREDELMKRSEPRKDDRFDLPPR